MKFLCKGPKLSTENSQAMTRFYGEVLSRGYSRYPLSSSQLIVWMDNEAKFLYVDRRWSLGSEYLYIGSQEDAGSGSMEDPSNRLGVILAMMAETGHTSDAELLKLVEQRLSTILAGVYKNCVAPLAQREDGREVTQIAWSVNGGIAGRLDGRWVSPVTGEGVQVDSSWVVVGVPEEVGETSAAEEGQLTTNEEFVNWANRVGYSMQQAEDGRLGVNWSLGSESNAREVKRLAEEAGLRGIVIETLRVPAHGRDYIMVTTQLQSVPSPLSF